MPTWNRSHLIDTRYTAVRRNLASVNPSFEVDAPTGTLFATNLLTNPSFETASATTVEIRRNQLINPNLSAGIGSWNVGSLTHTAVTGGRQFTAVAAGTQTIYSTAIAITPGTPVAAQVRVGVPAGQPGLTFRLLLRDGAAFVSSGNVPVATGAQAVLTYVGTGPAFSPPGTTIRADVIVDTAAIGNQWVVYDDATVEAVDVALPMFSGSSPAPDADQTVVWAGAANASVSLIRGLAPAATSIDGGIVSTLWTRHGASSMRFIPRPASNGVLLTYAVLASTTGSGGTGYLLQAGKTYTAVAWLRQTGVLTGSPSSSGARQIVFAASGANGSTLRSTQATNAAGVYEHRLVFQVNSNTDTGQLRLYHGHPTGSGDVWWDDVMLVEGVYDGPFFDGTYSDEPALVTAWTGAANASSSTASSTSTRAFQNLALNPAGNAAGTAWTMNAGVLAYSTGPALGDMPTSARATRLTTAATRFSVSTALQPSTTYTVRFHTRASETLSSVQVVLRPGLTSTGQLLLGTVSIPAGESVFTFTGTTTSTAISEPIFALVWSSGSVGSTLDVVVLVAPGTSEPGFVFDGDTVDTNDPVVAFSWDGAAYASTSSGYVASVWAGGVPEITYTNQVLNPRPSSTQTAGSQVVRRNLATNPKGVNSTGWSLWNSNGTGGVTSSIAEGPVGLTSARRVSWTAGSGPTTGGGIIYTSPQFGFTVPAGTVFRISGYVRAPFAMNITPQMVFQLAGVTSSGTIGGPSAFSIPANTWTRIDMTATTTATSDQIQLRFYRDGTGAELLWLDASGMLYEQSATLEDYFDGSSVSADPLLTYAWVGTANASQSTITGIIPGAANHWTPSNLIRYYVTDTFDTAVEFRDLTGASSGYATITLYTYPGQGRWVATAVDIKPLRSSSGTPGFMSVTLGARTRTGSTNQDQAVTTTSLPVGVWTRMVAVVQQNYPTPDNVLLIFYAADRGTAPAGLQYRARRGSITFGDTQGAAVAAATMWFDGASVDTTWDQYDWTGTAHASTSTRLARLMTTDVGVITGRSTDWAATGASSLVLVPSSASNDSYLQWGGLTRTPWSMRQGRTYVIAATRRLDAPITGTLHANFGRIVVRISRNGTSWDGALTVASPVAANVAGVERTSVMVSVPNDATGVGVALYHGGAVGADRLWWDDVLVADVTGMAPGDITTSFFDGSFPWAAWDGTANASSSVGYRWALP